MIYLQDRQGRAVQFEDETVGEALASGQFAPVTHQVNAFDPQGNPVTIPAQHVLESLGHGFVLETHEQAQRREVEDKLGGPGAFAAAIGTGLMRGASLGLSDVIMTGTDVVEPKTLAQLKEGLAAESVTSEIVGAVGAALLTKKVPTPAGFVSKLGITAAETVKGAALRRLAGKVAVSEVGAVRRALAGVAGHAAGGAIEGAIWGGGHAISEHDLGQTDDLAEALVANVGPAALLGGAVGGGFGLVSEVAGPTFNKIVKSVDDKLKGAKSGLHDQAVVDAVELVTGSNMKAVAKKVGREIDDDWMIQAEELLITGRAVPVDAAGEVVIMGTPKAMDRIAGFEPVLKGGLKTFDDLAVRFEQAAIFAGKSLGNVRHGAKMADVYVTGGEIAELILPTIDDAMSVATGKFAMDAGGRKILQKMKNDLLTRVKGKSKWNPVELQDLKEQIAHTAYSIPEGKRVGKIAKMIERDLKDLQDENLQRVLTEPEFEEYTRAMGIYSWFKGLEKISPKGAKWRKASKGWFSKMGDWALRSAAWRAMAGSLRAATGTVGTGAALLGGSKALSKIGGVGSAPLIKHKLSNLSALQAAADAVDTKIGKAVKAFMKASRKATVPASTTILNRMSTKRDSSARWRDVRDKLASYQADPEYGSAAVAANFAGLADAAPETTSKATAVLGGALQSAAVVQPQNRPDMLPQVSLDLEENIPDEDLGVIKQKLTGSMDPMGSVADLGNLQMAPTQARIFRQTWPRLAALVDASIREAVSQSTSRLSYDQLFQFSVFTGQAMAYSLQQMPLQRAQAVFAAVAPQQQPPTQSGVGEAVSDIAEDVKSAHSRMEDPV